MHEYIPYRDCATLDSLKVGADRDSGTMHRIFGHSQCGELGTHTVVSWALTLWGFVLAQNR